MKKDGRLIVAFRFPPVRFLLSHQPVDIHGSLCHTGKQNNCNSIALLFKILVIQRSTHIAMGYFFQIPPAIKVLQQMYLFIKISELLANRHMNSISTDHLSKLNTKRCSHLIIYSPNEKHKTKSIKTLTTRKPFKTDSHAQNKRFVYTRTLLSKMSFRGNL